MAQSAGGKKARGSSKQGAGHSSGHSSGRNAGSKQGAGRNSDHSSDRESAKRAKPRSSRKSSTRQQSFLHEESKHRWCSGGTLRKLAKGRGARRLSTKHLLHVVFKAERRAIPKGLRHPDHVATVRGVIHQYARKFLIRLEQFSIQGDHIHILLRAKRREHYHAFHRVVAGQIAQRLMTGTPTETYAPPRLWKHRPFSRVVAVGKRAYRTVKAYVMLNELEAEGKVPYRKERTRGLTDEGWEGSGPTQHLVSHGLMGLATGQYV